MADPVGARIQGNNKDGEEVVERRPVTPSEQGVGVQPLDPNYDLNVVNFNKYIEQESKRLPGDKEEIDNINWFGGSYAGADMKVVAHLYEPTNHDEELTKMQQELSLAEKIRDGAARLVEGGITDFAISVSPEWDYPTRRSVFYAAAGITESSADPIEEEAGRFLWRNIYVGSNWGTFLGVAKTKRKAENIKVGHAQLAKSMQDRIDALKKIKDKGTQTVVLATLQTLSVQSHREKYAVRALGHSYVKGYTRGPRTIAGSMIFTVFNEHALASLMRSLGRSKTYGELDAALHTVLPDQLPPLDLTVSFANEYGSVSSLRLFGVEFINDGATYSIEDLLTENVINFVARDADPMTSHGNIQLHRNQSGMNNEYAGRDLSGTDLVLGEEAYRDYLQRLGLRRRFSNR